MTNEFKKVCEGLFCFFLLSIQWTAGFGEEANQIVNLLSSEPRAKLGEACLYKICEENLFCNFGPNTCQCQLGFKIYNNECIPDSVSGENEPCISNEDCCGRLVCINGFCRKPVPNAEFVTLAKICLGITVTTIIIAVFSSIVKCLLRYDNSRIFIRQSRNSSFTSPLTRQMRNQDRCVATSPNMYDFRDEKPPSYEECIRSSGRGPVSLEPTSPPLPPLPPPPPPPYIISTNIHTSVPESNQSLPSPNLSVPSQQNLTTPLNVQSLSHDVNTVATETKSSEKSEPDAAIKKTCLLRINAV